MDKKVNAKDDKRDPRWERPAIEWEEDYEAHPFQASCAQTPGQCGGATRL